MKSRRKWIALGAVGALVMVATAIWLWWLPSYAVDRGQAMLADRSGLPATIGGASIGLFEVTLSDIRVGEPDGALTVEIASVRAPATPWGLAFQGSAAIDHLVADGITVTIDASAEGWLDGLPRPTAGAEERDAQGRSTSSPSRVLEAHNLSVTLSDGQGPLVTAHKSAARIADDGIEVRLGELVLGGPPLDTGRLEGVRLRLTRGEHGAQLRELSTEAGTLVWARRERREEDEGPDPALVARLAALVAGMHRDGDVEEEPPDDAEGVPPWLARLTPDVRVTVASLDVAQRTAGGERTVLHDFEAAIEGRGQHVFRAVGSGETGTGGQIRWDVSLEPLAATAEGSVRFDNLSLALVAPLLPAIPWHEPERARLDGQLVIRSESAARFAVDGSVSLVDAAVSASRIAPNPVRHIGIRVDGSGFWDPLARRLQLESASIELGEAVAHIDGAIEWAPDHYLIDLTVDLPPTRCNEAVNAIPRDLRGETTGFTWKGSLAGRMVAQIDSRKLDDTVLDVRVADSCEFVTVPAMADLRRVQGPFTHRVKEPDGTFFQMETGPGTPNWVSIHAMSPYLLQAVISHEDGAFMRHDGFATWAIRDALVRNLKEGRFVLGASTISMQLTKNLLLHREKTLARKVQEVILTWWIESALEKREMLELYLNIIEYGPALYGIGNATRHYFGREPADLSPAEAAFLACILPGPKTFHQQYEDGPGLSKGMQSRVRNLLEHMNNRGRISDEALEFGLQELPAFSFYYGGGHAPPRSREVPKGADPFPFQLYWDGWSAEAAPAAEDAEGADTFEAPFDPEWDEPI